jgi:hypothetical protein
MGFTPTTHSLSALTPVKFTYKFNKEEKLSSDFSSFNNGLRYFKHTAFDGFQDAALSKKNCLILTDNKPLKDVFQTDSKQLSIGQVAGCLFLQTITQKYVRSTTRDIYVGNTGEKLLINIMPLFGNTVELKSNKTKFIQIDKEYPYTAILSEERLNGADVSRQRFELEYQNGLISFKTITKEGYRYLSYGKDQILRAVGLTLNETTVNPYLFNTEFVSENGLYYDFDAKTSEVKYFNEFESTFIEKSTVNIKDSSSTDTNLLVSCATTDISLSSESLTKEVAINIALLKTNFTSVGSYLNK